MATAFLLLVDDDPLMGEMLRGELDDAGFAVIVAHDGSQALAALDRGAARFQAVITDVDLGRGPDGWQIGRRARECVANMPVVYISGDSGHEWPSRGVPDSVIIAKPFAPDRLVATVATLIAGTDAHLNG